MTEGLWQVVVGSAAAVIGLGTGALVWIQTRKHFRLVRSSEYIERFNSEEFFDARITVDTFHEEYAIVAAVLEGEASSDPEKVRVRTTILRFANLFQELGGSYLRRTVDRYYIWIMFGYLAQLYWRRFEPMIQGLRNSRNRPQLYQDFEVFASEMRRLDTKYRLKEGHPKSRGGVPTPEFLFAYGSLVSPASIAKSLGRDLKRELRAAWLDDHRRSWSVFAAIEPIASNDAVQVLAAFLNITPCDGATVNGVLVPVSMADLVILDRREFMYHRLDVSPLVRPRQTGRVWAYVGGQEKVNTDSVCVATEYLRIIEEAFEYWGRGFKEEFWRGTVGQTFQTFEGQYRFLKGDGADAGKQD